MKKQKSIYRYCIFSLYPDFIYVFGGGVVNSLVSYRTWRWVGENEFPKFHQIDSSLIIPLFVIFFSYRSFRKYYYSGFGHQ
jgi:hypothetical protein